MPRIKLLDESIAQKIAAGEVVESPTSVIKELVENAIDAGSSFITVEIRDGGNSFIRVSDNGSGIYKDDMALAFTRHATSKIATADDLFNIRQMGFRGEALYSICAVSKLEMLSKPADQTFGSRIRIQGGEIIDHIDYGCPDGSSVTVQDLFYNTPARKKFMRSASNEASRVTAMMAKLLLANPKISVKLVHNQRVVFHSAGDGNLQNAVYAVYGAQVAQGMLCAQAQSGEGDYSVHGMVGSIDTHRSSRGQQTLLVNRRPVNHPPFTRMIEDQYAGVLPARRYPVFVLNIDLPPGDVDVNVHPNKLQVRFGNESQVRRVILSAVSQALGAQAYQPVDILPEPPLMPLDLPVERTSVFNSAELPRSTTHQSMQHMRDSINSAVGSFSSPKTSLDIQKELAEPLVLREPTMISAAIQAAEPPSAAIYSAQPRVVGQLFSVYLVLEAADGMYIVDQHAAHERLLFDRFSAGLTNSQSCSQPLLTPVPIDLSYEEKQVLDENLETFVSMGFDLEEYGRLSYQVRSVPFVLGQPEMASYLKDALYMLVRDRQITGSADLKKERLMSMACRKAIKAGDNLSNEEITALVDILSAENTPLTCPHGRPFALKITKHALDKHFKRV